MNGTLPGVCERSLNPTSRRREIADTADAGRALLEKDAPCREQVN